MNPEVKEFSHYSDAHNSYTRIDFFLTSLSLMDFITDTSIYPISVSDHTPISMTFQGLSPQTRTRFWNFPSYLTKSDDFKTYLKLHCADFVDYNISHIENAPLFWATSKSVLRGHIISYVSSRRKEANSRFISYTSPSCRHDRTCTPSFTPDQNTNYGGQD